MLFLSVRKKQLFCAGTVKKFQYNIGAEKMKTYTPEKKQEAIDRFISGESAAAILADIGIPKAHFIIGCAFIRKNRQSLTGKR